MADKMSQGSLEDDDNLIIDQDEEISKAHAKYYEYLQQKHLCDIEIILEDGSIFPAHKIILSSRASYFEEAIYNDPQITRIQVTGVTKEVMHFLLKYLYTGEICLDIDTALEIWSTVRTFDIKYLQDACHEMIRNSLNLNNCVDIFNLSKQIGDKQVLESSIFMMEVNFSELVKNDTTCKLNYSDIDYLSSRLILHANEDEVLEMILKWLVGKENITNDQLEKLISNVSLSDLTQSQLNKLKSTSFTKDLNVIQSFNNENAKASTSPLRFPTACLCLYNNDDGTVFFFDLLLKQWNSTANVILWTYDYPLINLHDTLFGQCITHHNGLVVVTGSRLNNRATPWIYGFKTKTWVKGPNLNFPRCYHTATGFGDYLYVIGGIASDNRQVERLKITSAFPEKSEWEVKAPLVSARYSHGSNILNVNGLDRIIVFGGCNQSENLKSVEMYIHDLDTWKELADMNKCGRDILHGVSSNKLYVGKSDDEMRYFEVYEPETNQWTMLSVLKFTPVRGKMMQFKNNLFGICRIGNKQEANIVQFSIQKNEWSIIDDKGPVLPCEAQQLILNY